MWFIGFLLLSNHFISGRTTSEYCQVDTQLAELWETNHNSRNSCCEVSTSQWGLIGWYFARVGSSINVTEIIRESDYRRHQNNNNFIAYFLKDLYKYTGIEYITERIVYSFGDEIVDRMVKVNINPYIWTTDENKRFNYTDDIEENKRYIRSKLIKQHRQREDEPEFGKVIISSDIRIIDNYLNGQKRALFDSKRSIYVIIIYEQSDVSWDLMVSQILAKLWKIHGILNAIVLVTCQQIYVGLYDPFENTRRMNITNQNVDEWGIYRRHMLKYLDYTDNWMLQKAYSLNQYPLTVSIFERYPTMVSHIPKYFADTPFAEGMKKSGYGGIDGFFLGNFAQQMDFTINTIHPQDDETYGFDRNNTFTGTLGDVLYGRADIAFNSRFFLYYGTEHIRTMFPVIGDKVCVVVPSAEKTAQWKAIFKCFDWYFWCSLYVSTVITSLIYSLLKFYREKREMRFLRRSLLYKDFKNIINEKEVQMQNVYGLVWKAIFGMITKMPDATMERSLIGACLLANIIIAGSMGGLLYKAYTEDSPKNINTLEDLDNSGLKIIASSPSFENLFGNSQNNSQLFSSLRGKIFLGDSNLQGIERVARSRDVCTLERYSDVNIMIKTRFHDDDGRPHLHVVAECPRHYFLTYIVNENFPLLYRFNKLLIRYAEAGLGPLWYEKTEEAFILYESIVHRPDHKNPRKPFSMNDIQAPFRILIMGYVLSFIVLLIEKYVLPPKKLAQVKRFICPVKCIKNDVKTYRHRNVTRKRIKRLN